ncbi:MAG TPA: DNA mismatch repair protein MutS [Leptospiraceae bacterium]|nr:DNA mismatch repair protein MutS [Leptospiraceae bacterium]
MQKESDPLATPAMKQFAEIKSKHPDGILFFRMGDFYEMFMEDAITASAILDIALTKRQNQIPMCGIPYHATESYISRLINAKKKVVICEQIKSEDPNVKLMQREVVRIITPGTIIEENLLGSYQNNYFAVFLFDLRLTLVAFADISTGDLYYFSFNREDTDSLFATIRKFDPKEIMLISEEESYWSNYHFDEICVTTILSKLEIDFSQIDKTVKFSSLEILIRYIVERNFKKNGAFAFKNPVIMDDSEYMELDEDTVRNLDLIENQNDASKHHSLFSVLNKCQTGIGKRVLKNRILFPTKSKSVIESIWNQIQILDKNKKIKNDLIQELSEFSDIERIISRFRGGKGLPRDFRTIQKTIEISKSIADTLKKINYKFNIPESRLDSIYSFIGKRLSENELPPILGGDGEFLKTGFDLKLDKAREAKIKGKDWIIELEEKERKSLGLNTLKIRYNKVVGFYVELSRKDAELAPSRYHKKQTLVTSERFTFPELEEIERTILEADEIIQSIEKEEFENMMKEVLKEFHSFIALSKEIGQLDFTLSLTECKNDYNWTLPNINDKGELSLVESRHPVIEKFMKVGERFVGNDVYLNRTNSSIAILTGPNMAGKSTYMRQIAICQILFQMGSYIPAKKANLSIVDKLFTRIGSGDDITTGQSTFFVEMKETAHILKNKTSDSLVLFDEIGRGTSTYDGMSLAWAILEKLSGETPLKTKTIFATHYHELTHLEKESGIFNLYMDTVEEKEEIIFIKKVRMGKAKKSFGIYVAKLAGIPESIIQRAKVLLEGLESKKKEIKLKPIEEPMLFPKVSEESTRHTKIIQSLEKIKIESITPMEAMQILNELQKMTRNSDG